VVVVVVGMGAVVVVVVAAGATVVVVVVVGVVVFASVVVVAAGSGAVVAATAELSSTAGASDNRSSKSKSMKIPRESAGSSADGGKLVDVAAVGRMRPVAGKPGRPKKAPADTSAKRGKAPARVSQPARRMGIALFLCLRSVPADWRPRLFSATERGS
jgi:hypothetical protein